MTARPGHSDGTTDTERVVLARWDAGQSKQRIVRETGLTSSVVDKIVTRFHDSHEELRFERDVRAASQALAAACIATGKRFL